MSPRISRASRSIALRSSPTRLQHDELVAAETGDEMAPRRLLKALARLDEQRVPGRVAERVVDDLELVEVEAVKRKKAAVAAAMRKQMLQLLLEHRPVGQGR